jgi:ribosomal protein S15P/S13E
MYCTVCQKERKTHIRITKPSFLILEKLKENSPKIYEREVCIKCQSSLLIAEIPNFKTHIKVSKKDKRAEKRHLRNMYISQVNLK